MGSLLQCVLTPGDRWMGRSTERITKEIDSEVRRLFPSSKNLKLLWSNVVQVPQSLYRESPGMDPYRPDQKDFNIKFLYGRKLYKTRLYRFNGGGYYERTSSSSSNFR